MDIAQAIYGHPIATWVRESNSLLAFTGLLFLHAVGLAFTVGVSGVIALRVLGFATALPLGSMATLFRVVWVAYAVTAFSGVLLLMGNAINDLSNPLFYTKLLFVGLAAISVRATETRVFARGRFHTTSAKLLASASLASWTLAIIAGRLSEYPSLFGLGN